MKPAAFAYRRAATVDEAIAALQEAAGEAKLIAGGQSLGPMLNLRLARPARLIDIGTIESLGRIEVGDHSVRVGAGVTHARIEDEAGAIEGLAPLAHVARGIAYRAIRNRGTVGGSLAHADPAADWPLVLATLGAAIEIRGAGRVRRVDAAAFMLGPYATSLAYGEILAAVEIPKMHSCARWAYRKFCRKPGEFAEAAAAALFDPDRRIARVLLGAPAARPTPLPALARDLARGGRSALDTERLAEEIEPLVADAPPHRRQAALTILRKTLEEVLQ
ncbi:MAG: FAD binding domain-containing protein [Burkholderiales bacterium]|nr:FAD binding domain-containing protein [Burkholderiales bacterium]OJX07430.1 MAG: hypothetical protein BGO72_08200 [Burkholderiales bacterium 70-64]